MSDAKAKGTPFREAIDYFRDKVRLPTRHWTDVYEEAHARAFVVAGAVKDDLLADFQRSIARAIEEGRTLEDFRKDFDSIVQRHGWSYNGSRGWRSKTIYHTNMRQAHMAGRWQQAQRLKKTRPYLRYVAIQGGDRRPEHQALHGTVRPVDDPFWDVYMPQNGWGCKCSVQSLSDADLKRYGLSVSPPPQIQYEKRTINTPGGPREVTVPHGVDPGFAYNPGKAAWGRQLSEKAMADYKASGAWKKWTRLTPGDYASAGRGLVPMDKPLARLGEKAKGVAGVRAALEKALSGKEKVFTLADDSALLLNAEAMAAHLPVERSPFIPLLPEVLTSPHEIWVSFERHEVTGRIALRKRLIKVVALGEENKLLLLVANASRGLFEGWTFIPIRRLQEANRHRVGQLLWGRE